MSGPTQQRRLRVAPTQPKDPPDPADVFEALYRSHHDFVRRSLRAMGVPEAATDDITQDVFIIVHRRLSSFDHRSALKGWIYGIARNCARRHRQRRMRFTPSLELVHAPAPALPDSEFERRQAARVVEAFLARLDAGKHGVFVLCEVEGMTAPEAAGVLGVKLNTIYSRLRTVRALFARYVARAELQAGRNDV